MRKSLIASLLGLVALAMPAWASDLPVKIRPEAAFTGYPYQGNGIYGGIGAVGAVLSANVDGGGTTTNLFTAGAALDLTAGYQWSTPGNWYAVEGSVQYTNIGGSVMCGTGTPCSITSKWGFEQRALIGFPVATVLSVLPNWSNFFPGLPALPGGVNASTTNTHPYLFAGLREDDVSAAFGFDQQKAWKVQPLVGIGLRQQWTQGLVVDTSASCTFANTGFALGVASGSSVSFGRDCRVALRFLY